MAKTAILSWNSDLFLTFFIIRGGYFHIPNGVFWGSTSRPHIGDLVMNLFFLLWGPEFMTGDGPKTVHFGPKMAKHGKIVNVDTALRAKVLANKQMLRSLAFDCS